MCYLRPQWFSQWQEKTPLSRQMTYWLQLVLRENSPYLLLSMTVPYSVTTNKRLEYKQIQSSYNNPFYKYIISLWKGTRGADWAGSLVCHSATGEVVKSTRIFYFLFYYRACKLITWLGIGSNILHMKNKMTNFISNKLTLIQLMV